MARKIIDWDLIEVDWRANVKTKQQISAEYGVSRAAMDKRFAKLGIERDLSGKIRAKTDALVTQSVVTHEVTPQTGVTEKQIVEANAALQSNIILAHRTDIQRSRKLTMALMAELELQTDNLDLLERLRELLHAPDEKGVDKRDELFRKVISLGSRSSTMKTLSESLKNMIALERQAFNIDEARDTDTPATISITF